MAIANKSLSIGNNTVLQVPEGKQYAITTIIVCNTNSISTNTVVNFDLHLIQGTDIITSIDDAVGDKNRVIHNIKLNSGESFTFDSERIILENNDVILIKASTNTGLSVTVSYIEG